MPDARQIIELHEREVRLFSRSDLFDQYGRSLILPETRALSAVELREAVEGVQLRALGLIGYLPLTNDIVLNLRPKFSTESLWYMLDIADEAYERVLPVIRSYQKADEAAPHHLLARAFCHYLGELLGSGIWRGYKRQSYEGYYRPKVLFGPTLSRFISRGNEIASASETFSFSGDLAANRFLKTACLRFLSIVPRDKAWAAERGLLIAALGALESVQACPMYPENWSAVEQVPMRVRKQYRGALAVFAILLGQTNIGFSYEAAGSELPSFLFCLDDVFEAFVRNICRAGFRAAGISVADGNKPKNQSPLFTDNKRFPIKPDLICRREKATVAIGEVKYKPKIDEADRYQVISHVIALGAPIGIWISPANAEDEAGLEYIGAVTSGARFYHYRLFIGHDLPSACNRMVGELGQLVQ